MRIHYGCSGDQQGRHDLKHAVLKGQERQICFPAWGCAGSCVLFKTNLVTGLNDGAYTFKPLMTINVAAFKLCKVPVVIVGKGRRLGIADQVLLHCKQVIDDQASHNTEIRQHSPKPGIAYHFIPAFQRLFRLTSLGSDLFLARG